jgi:hypothetical protein
MLVQDARKTKKKQEKLQSQMIKPTRLTTVDQGGVGGVGNPARYNTGTNENYPTEALTMGKWIAKDPRDTRMKNLRDLNQKGGLGTIQAPTEEALSWIEDKQNQIYQQSLLRLATALIDPNNPESQERAYAIMPSLQKVPESHLKDEVAMQMSLNSILRDGVLRGPEDLQFIFHILDPNVELPLNPLWDLSGAFNDEIEKARKAVTISLKSGIFSPFKYGTTIAENDTDMAKAQLPIKTAIVKRLFPAFRNKSTATIQDFINDISVRKTEILPGEIGFVGANAKRQRGPFDPYKKMLETDI